MELTLAARRQVTARLARRYQRGTKAEKSAVLDQVCAVNGWHRDHARKALRTWTGQPPPRQARPPAYRYGTQVIDALRFVWAVADGPTGKRLAPMLPVLVDSLRRHGELDISDDTAAALVAMSPATIDRRLAPDRAQLSTKPFGRSLTRPGSLLKSQIPLKTWAEWDDTRPGFLEIDLVGHDGGDNNGQFCWTLTATDVATGWTLARTVRSKGERVVADALEQIRLQLPFHVAGIHSDNGSEFINNHLLRWTQARQITFTRGRPAHKNDNAHVEQKNWVLPRRCAGYFRYDTAREERLLNDLWATETIVFNLFNAQQKLVAKTRQGAKVTKRYDTARTPADRLLTDFADFLDPHDRDALQAQLRDANPAQLRRRVAVIQGNLVELARRRGPVPHRPQRHHVYDSKTKGYRPAPTRASTDESTTQTKRAS